MLFTLFAFFAFLDFLQQKEKFTATICKKLLKEQSTMKIAYSQIVYKELKPTEKITDIKTYIDNKVKNKIPFNLYILVDESKGFPVFCNICNGEDEDTNLLQTETAYLHPHNSRLHFLNDSNGYDDSLYNKLSGKEVFTDVDFENIQEKETLYGAFGYVNLSWMDYVK